MLNVRYVGLDVHKDSIMMAVAEWGREEAQHWGRIANDWPTLQRQLHKLQQGSWELQICYEAGPTGFELHRRMIEAGYACQVVAPALVPQQAGRRIKTDRRDAPIRSQEPIHHVSVKTPTQHLTGPAISGCVKALHRRTARAHQRQFAARRSALAIAHQMRCVRAEP